MQQINEKNNIKDDKDKIDRNKMENQGDMERGNHRRHVKIKPDPEK
jgi:hypothetical protein